MHADVCCVAQRPRSFIRGLPPQVVGCIVEQGGRVLLCRRAIQPCAGKWTLPAGYLELSESTAGVRRGLSCKAPALSRDALAQACTRSQRGGHSSVSTARQAIVKSEGLCVPMSDNVRNVVPQSKLPPHSTMGRSGLSF